MRKNYLTIAIISFGLAIGVSSLAWCASYEADLEANKYESVDQVPVTETKEAQRALTLGDLKAKRAAVQAQIDKVDEWRNARIAERDAYDALIATVQAEAEKADLLVQPVAAFDADKTSGEAPLAVVFTDKSTGEIESYVWDFGDDETSVEASPKHTYAKAGSYKAVLTVTGIKGHTSQQAVEITVNEIGEVEPK